MASAVVPEDIDVDHPRCLKCPITLEILRDPVIDAFEHTFERAAIENALRKKPGFSPLTNERYPNGEARLLSNRAVKDVIQEYLERKGKASLASASEPKLSDLRREKEAAEAERRRAEEAEAVQRRAEEEEAEEMRRCVEEFQAVLRRADEEAAVRRRAEEAEAVRRRAEEEALRRRAEEKEA
eukprot:1179241-Prorocentrum_minimum.AAC.4